MIHWSVIRTWSRFHRCSNCQHLIYPSTILKADRAISRLRLYFAPEICGISAELLKAGGVCCSQWLTNIMCKDWRSASAPDDWNRDVILHFYKGPEIPSQTVEISDALLSYLYQAIAQVLLSSQNPSPATTPNRAEWIHPTQINHSS